MTELFTAAEARAVSGVDVRIQKEMDCLLRFIKSRAENGFREFEWRIPSDIATEIEFKFIKMGYFVSCSLREDGMGYRDILIKW